jgi:hypothetical protein
MIGKTRPLRRVFPNHPTRLNFFEVFWNRTRNALSKTFVTRVPGQQQKKERSIMKRALVASVLAFAFIGMTGGSALAQKKGAAKPAAGAADGKVKNYDFSGDNIEGELIKPDGEMVNTRKFAEHTSLIRVRQDFIREIVKSADNL